MDRTILYRGKRVDNGKWIEGCFCEISGGDDLSPAIQIVRQVPSYTNYMYPVLETEIIEVDYETVGQYTRFKDDNGRKVFEGDILSIYEVHKHKEYKYITDVVWEDGSFMYKGRPHKEYKRDYYDTYLGALIDHERAVGMAMEIEVIGNIYDNPELL